MGERTVDSRTSRGFVFRQAERRLYFNQIPTNFSLTDEQVDDLIAAGRELLINNTEFQRFIKDLGKDQQ